MIQLTSLAERIERRLPTKPQAEILAYLRDEIELNGNAPDMQHLADVFGCSRRRMHYLILEMHDKRLVVWDPKKPKMLRPIERPSCTVPFMGTIS